jgi:hypothetical protein
MTCRLPVVVQLPVKVLISSEAAVVAGRVAGGVAGGVADWPQAVTKSTLSKARLREQWR